MGKFPYILVSEMQIMVVIENSITSQILQLLSFLHWFSLHLPSPQKTDFASSLVTYAAWIPGTKSNDWLVMPVRDERLQSQVESCEHESHDTLTALRSPVSPESWQED